MRHARPPGYRARVTELRATLVLLSWLKLAQQHARQAAGRQLTVMPAHPATNHVSRAPARSARMWISLAHNLSASPPGAPEAGLLGGGITRSAPWAGAANRQAVVGQDQSCWFRSAYRRGLSLRHSSGDALVGQALEGTNSDWLRQRQQQAYFWRDAAIPARNSGAAHSGVSGGPSFCTSPNGMAGWVDLVGLVIGSTASTTIHRADGLTVGHPEPSRLRCGLSATEGTCRCGERSGRPQPCGRPATVAGGRSCGSCHSAAGDMSLHRQTGKWFNDHDGIALCRYRMPTNPGPTHRRLSPGLASRGLRMAEELPSLLSYEQ